MLAKSRCLLPVLIAIVSGLAVDWVVPTNCLATCKRIPVALGSTQDELSDEEAKSIKIADRFFSILEKSPRRGTALERVYGHHVEFGTLDEFLDGLRERTKVDPEDGAAWMLLGMFESHRGQDAEAVDAFTQAEQFRTDDAMPSYYLGQSLLLIGQPEKAVEAFERAIDRKPRRPDMLEIFRQLGRVHQRAQRTEEALKVWDRLEELFPDDARVQEQIAITMVEEGEYELALPRYEKLATLVKDDYRRVTFNIEAAELKIRLSQRDEGIADLENLLADLNPTGWLFRDVRRRIEDIFLRSGDQDGLVTYYEKWIEKNPEDIGAIARLARFLASSARIEEASQWMEKALKLAPKRTDLRKSFIDQLVNDQRYDEASKQYAELVKSAPGNPDFLRDWGKLVMKDRKVEKSKRREQAVKIWSRIVEARPNDALTHAQVADLYRQSGLEAEAIERYEKAIELSPGEPQYREYLGEYFHILKRPEDALKTWESIAEGKRNSAENVARLAEVYNSFGYLPQAVEKIAMACELEPKEFTLQLKAAEYHMRHNKFDEALAYNAAANDLSASDEESELALKNRIEIFQTNRKLAEEVDRLRAEVENSSEPTVDAWHTLARYLEADRDWAGATEALEKALAIDEKSIPVLTSAARVAEASGDYGRAAAENRKLANIDRRLRSEHLMNVARLEAQLGNSDEALAAGKELIVSAPGNTDNYQFYSQLCYRLGETEEALDTLRKAVRINPTEPSLTMALGKALAGEFRTDEAIEVYWRAFEKSEELDDKTSLVQKLTALYEQQNQFDKLLERLERDRREESKRREMTICIAQAHNSANDYGTARRELESLLTDNTKDTNLLNQLSKLCESGSDLAAAVEYQTQLTKIAPGHETEFRLAKLLFSNGQREAASEIFVKLTAREENPVRLLKSVDSLLQRSNFESVVKITEPLLSESRDDWELLYREGVAFAKQEKIDEAKIRFERILSLSLPHDKMGVVAEQKLKRANQKAKSNNNQGIRSKIPERKSAFQLAQGQTGSVKSAVGLAEQRYYSGNQLPPLWTPTHFGIARMAAYAWLSRFESDAEVEKDVAVAKAEDLDDVGDAGDLDDGEEAEEETPSFTDAVVERGMKEDAEQTAIYDWFYVENLRGNYARIFDIARRMAVDGGKPEQKFFLTSLPMRHMDPKNMQNGRQQNVADPDPLSEADIELMLKCYKATSKEDDGFGSAMGSGQVMFSGGRMYVRVGNSWHSVSNGGSSMAQVVKELKLSGKTELAEEMISEKIAAAKKPAQLVQAMAMMISEKKLDRLDEFFAKWKAAAVEEIELAPIKLSRRGKSSNKHSADQTPQILGTIRKWTGPLAAEEENAKVLSIINDVLDVGITEQIKKRKQAEASRRKKRSRNNYYNNDIAIQYGDKASSVRVDYPRPGDYLSTTGLHMLRQAYEVLKRNEVEEDVMTLVRERVKKAESDSPETLIYEQMLLGTLLFWQEEKDEAIETFRAVATQLKDDVDFQFEIANLYEKIGDFDESLNIIEAIEPRDQKLVQKKELAVLRLAERLGDLDRARTAAERLFGLRLKAETQLTLVKNMKRLGMVEMADAIVSRARRRSGQKLSAMASLMGLYQGQGKTELAQQVAHRILQRTRSAVSQAASVNRNRRYGRSSNSDEGYRRSAISTLQQTGALDAVIKRLEEQQKRSPDSPAIYEKLIEFQMQTNNADKLIPLLESAVKARPKSSYFREQLAKQYSAKGKNEEACEQYAAAIRENPSMLSSDYYPIKQFFESANKMDELLKIFQEINIREIGQPYYVANFASELLRQTQRAETDSMSKEEREANEATELAAISLAEKIFEEYPNYRRYVISNFNGEKIWENKRLYSLARRAIIPTKNQVKTDPWFGLNDISSRSGDGNANSMFHSIFQGIEGTEQEKTLYDTIRSNVEKKPNWKAGQVMLAMFDVRDDKEDQAKASLTKLFEDKKTLDSLHGDSAWLVAQELEKFTETRQLAIKLLETAAKAAENDNNSQTRYSPVGKLISIYVDADDKEKAKELLLESVKRKSHQNYDQRYQNYQRGETISWVAEKLVEIDCHADAVIVMQQLLNNAEMLDAWMDYGGNRVEKAKTLYSKALLKALQDDDPASVAEKIIAVRSSPRAGEGAFDLQVGISSDKQGRNSQQYHYVDGKRVKIPPKEAQVESKLLNMIDAMSKKEAGEKVLSKRLSDLKTQQPDDKSIAIANTWFQLEHAPDDSAAAVKSLLELIEKHPLDEIKDGRRPNSRQRRQAMQHVALWPLSKKCLASEDEELRQMGKQLGQYAIDGSKWQTDKSFEHRMLFAWGMMAVKNKDPEEAEAKWTQLLETVAARPTRKKKKADAKATPRAPRQIKAPGASMLMPREMNGLPLKELAGQGSEQFNRFSNYVESLYLVSPRARALWITGILQAPAEDKPQQTEEEKAKAAALIPPLTNTQFQVAHQIALAAADNDMVELSKRAMRELLKGGLPVEDLEPANSQNGRPRVIYRSPSSGTPVAQPGDATNPSTYGMQIAAVLSAWEKKKDVYDPAEVYAMLVDEIFPPNRPDEILLYPNTSNINNASVTSLGQTIVELAAKANQLEDLQQRIDQRAAKPLAEVSAMVLQGLISIKKEDFESTNVVLQKLTQRISDQPVPRDIGLACLVAVPAYKADESLRTACIEIYRKKLNTDKSPKLGKLATRVNRHLGANGGEKEVRNFIESYLVAQQAQYSNYGGDYGIYQMQRALFQAANDAAQSNLSNLALDYVGRGKDIKAHDYGDNEVTGWPEILRRVRTQPAEKRYESLKEWTLPKPNRQTVRFVAEWKPRDAHRLNDFLSPEARDLPEASLPGMYCNFLDLVDAAEAAGKMDDLNASIAELDLKKYPEIEALKICSAIRSDDPATKDMVKGYIKGHRERSKGKERIDLQTNSWCEHLVYRLCMQKSPELGELYKGNYKRIFQFDKNGSGKVAKRDFQKMRAAVLNAEALPGTTEPLMYWSSDQHGTKDNGDINSWSVSDDNQLMLLSSKANAMQWLNYPLAGDFKFSCELLRSADVSFGGTMVWSMKAVNQNKISVDSVAGHDAITQPVKVPRVKGSFGKLTIEVADGVLSQKFGGKVIYQEKLAGTYPWLLLHTSSSQLSVWRNPVFEGQPVVPKEVQLVIGDRMEGWSGDNESQISFRKKSQPKPKSPDAEQPKELTPEEYDWHAKEGVLYGKADQDAKENSDSLLRYRRPMAQGDRLSYEFRYDPQEKMANPILGAVVVALVDGENAQEHYAGDKELAEFATINNVLNSPHAIDPVQLKSGDWNQVELRIVDTNAEVTVNDVLVWRRPIAKLDNLYPGIQKYKTQAAEVRNLRLTGDWPEQLPEGLVKNPFASERELGDADRTLITEMTTDPMKNVKFHAFYHPEEGEEVATAQQRYEQFRDWVLPGNGHGIRLDYRTDPNERPAAEEQVADAVDAETKINCPAWDLMVTAVEAGKVDELTEAIDNIDAPKEKIKSKFRDVAALKTLLAIAQEDDAAARTHLGEIYASIKAAEAKAKKDAEAARKRNSRNNRGSYPSSPSIKRTSVTVPTWYAVDRPALLDCALSMQTQCKSRLANEILARIEKRADTIVKRDAQRPLSQWTALPLATQAKSGGLLDQWRLAGPGLLERLPGQLSSPLYFQSPLKGKFEITADVSRGAGKQCWLDYGGYAVMPEDKQHRTRIASGENPSVKAKKKVPRLFGVVRYRISVDNNVVETYVNDVRVSRYEFEQAPQPWFSLQANSNGGRPILQNVRITGQPEIPTEIDLLAADSPNWLGDLKRFEEEDSNDQQNSRQGGGKRKATWTLNRKGEVESGNLNEYSIITPIFLEKWLPYGRPMMEDGEFEFEMFADSKTNTLCHVALGQTAMILKEDGIWRHDIASDAAEEIADEKIADSKGAGLKDGDWNKILVRLVGDQATLLVNDQEVATFAITEAQKLRFPGLFCFSDISNARVRNIKLRGKWPTSLPSVEQQELAQQSDDPFVDAVKGEAQVYDLAKSIDELKAAGLEVSGDAQMESTSDGIKVTARKNSNGEQWPTVSTTVNSTNDFDISVDVADVEIANVTGWGCGIDLQIYFDDVEKTAITIGLRRDKEDDLFVLAQREYDQPDGERAYDFTQLFEPFAEGTFRLVRRGGKVYALAAAKGKPHQVIASFTIGGKKVSKFAVNAKSATDTSELDAVVKRLSVKVQE